MPRARPRKPRLSRMDAAVDAMAKYGFPEEKVKKTVKKLLEVYGGNEGWPFIEDSSYAVLLEALLADDEENTQHKAKECANQSKPRDMLEDERDVGTSSRALDAQQDEKPEDNIAAIVAVSEPTCSEVIRSSPEIHNGDGKDWKDIIQDPISGQVEDTANLSGKNGEDPTTKLLPPILVSKSPISISTPPPINSFPAPRRLPCYGWIESDDEEDADDFIFLKPASAVLGDKATLPQELSKSEKKRKSRWDQSPYDP